MNKRQNVWWHTIYHAPEYQVNNFGKVRHSIPMPYSEGHYKSFLTYEQVILMKHLRKNGVSLGILSNKFNMSKPAICNIVAGRRWKDILN